MSTVQKVWKYVNNSKKGVNVHAKPALYPGKTENNLHTLERNFQPISFRNIPSNLRF